MFAGWVNREQQAVIDYLKEENAILRGQMGGRRLRLNDDQRRRLAVKGKALGRKVLSEVAGIVTPDTILGWYRKLVASRSCVGRAWQRGHGGLGGFSGRDCSLAGLALTRNVGVLGVFQPCSPVAGTAGLELRGLDNRMVAA